ncbi:MAG: LysM peptidoglycan-binding domain-containing protein [Desulfotignum sp.]|jgi:LysM repeat protein|nr:LysM peptidoglycan-binding domain-containing protein [Desulfotignum sp.]
MKSKDKPGARTAPAQTSGNRKKKPAPKGPMAAGSSLLKKNEFTLIIAGALVVTLLVFFLFFRTSDSQIQTVSPSLETVPEDLEERLSSLESALENMQAKLSFAVGDGNDTTLDAALARIQQQVSRIEAAAQIKFDSLTERMGDLEQKLSSVSKLAADREPVKSQSQETRPVVKKSAAVQEKKSAGIFHTVKKGETLWRISQKYNTTVAALRKLNNLAPDADIYPGTNIMVR